MLPEGWAVYKTDEGMEYYHNEALGITQWDRPGEATVIGAGGKPPAPDFLPAALGGPSDSKRPVDLEAGKESQPSGSELFDSAKESALKYFDVSMVEIKDRLILAVLPYRLLGSGSSAPQDPSIFAEKPDFYGPLWIGMTAAFGLFAGGHAYEWASNMLFMTHYSTFYTSVFLIFFWLTVLPVTLRSISAWNGGSESAFQLGHVTCVYGYSLFPLLPLALVSALPSKVLQVIFCLASLSWSLAFLGVNFVKDLSQVPQGIRVWLVGTCVSLQSILFLLVPMYFYRLPVVAALPVV
eukprot:Protomagalhaensia_wolfi_Nauph_80__2560@NODE_2716_length_1008_cov_52_594427_g2127_i0_p1_GENE_NODE_2716_length_1008_cov_52_594427_g2127_i0NODE_2716_length_1008_cov_52_594427_g2127_i0_p1_ORF_typecomplete_len295_score35_00Yip1/PF04893_17/2_4e17WW/PF00397_26/1_6e07NPIP/PF06409_11/64NPIP/PF06409_11/18_NODE_2716_length_1008_cov_52_594427_g2127_i071955